MEKVGVEDRSVQECTILQEVVCLHLPIIFYVEEWSISFIHGMPYWCFNSHLLLSVHRALFGWVLARASAIVARPPKQTRNSLPDPTHGEGLIARSSGFTWARKNLCKPFGLVWSWRVVEQEGWGGMKMWEWGMRSSTPAARLYIGELLVQGQLEQRLGAIGGVATQAAPGRVRPHLGVPALGVGPPCPLFSQWLPTATQGR